MSAQDPLSEAREALRDAYVGLMSDDPVVRAWHRDELRPVLQRLDALPAPERVENAGNAFAKDMPAGWFQPDAPVARDDGGEDDA